jgi:hypothetical protein
MKKKAILITTLVLATALSAGAIAYIGYYQKNPSKTASTADKKHKTAANDTDGSSEDTQTDKTPDNNAGETVTYTNQRFGFRVDHLKSWPAEQSQNGDGTTIKASDEAGIMVRAYAYPTGIYSMDQVVKDREDSEKSKHPDLVVLEQKDTTVDDHPAVETLWRFNSTGDDSPRTGVIKMRGVYALKGSAVYSVECSAEEPLFDKYNEDFSKIIGSFKLK